MSSYKYIFFFSFFLFSCEKNNSIFLESNAPISVSLCDGSILKSSISVVSFNRLSNTSLNSVVQLIESVDPDIIALQESYEVGLEIADRFSYCFYGNPKTSTAILSKYLIEGAGENYSKIILNDSIYINMFNVHLPAYPYQPYDIRDRLITTESQAIYQAEQARGVELMTLASSILDVKNHNNMPIIVAGDFNEPSHLDWISGAENPIYFQIDTMDFVVDWPTSKEILQLGLQDTYRELHPDPILNPGYTWTPNHNIGEVHDRIDFIYYNQDNDYINLESIHIIGPDNLSNIVIQNYESDHRALLSVFKTTL